MIERIKRTEISRREFIKRALLLGTGTVVGVEVVRNLGWPKHLAEAAENIKLPWKDGTYQTFPGLATASGEVVYQYPDLGWHGPDMDYLFGFDFQGDIPTGALVVHRPKGKVLETRIIGVKRADLETVQFNEVLQGDCFNIHQISKYGGDQALGELLRLHAENTRRKHQKVVRIDDLGLFEKQWGEQEKVLLNRIIRAQRPSRPDLGIQDPDFVSPRTNFLRGLSK